MREPQRTAAMAPWSSLSAVMSHRDDADELERLPACPLTLFRRRHQDWVLEFLEAHRVGIVPRRDDASEFYCAVMSTLTAEQSHMEAAHFRRRTETKANG